jgi:hypothetical protein
VGARLLILCLLLLLPAAASARCTEGGVMVFPAPGAVIPTNAKMILEGIGAEQGRVSNLVGQELVLKASDDVISVKVVSGWKSAMGRVAVVLKPSQKLKPNKSYTLMIDSYLPNYELLNGGSADSVTWRTGDRGDERAPKYELKPSIAEGMYKVEGDQISQFLRIHTSLTEDSPAYLVVTIRRVRGGTGSQTYFVPLNGNDGYMGNDGCSGSFTFEAGRAYRATVEAYDSPGNAAPPLPQIEFQAPRPVRQ